MTWEQFEGQLDNPVMEASHFFNHFAQQVLSATCHDQAYFRSIDLSVTEARS